MNAAAQTTIFVAAVGLLVAVGVAISVTAFLLRCARERAEAALRSTEQRALALAATLAEQANADGHEARLRLIRAAHAAMNVHVQRGRHVR